MIYNDDILREEIKKLKLYKDIKYNYIANLLNIRPSSFYNYMKGQYSLSISNKYKLSNIIYKLKE